MKTTLLSFVCLVAGLASPLFSAMEAGQPAAGFTLTDSNGKSHSLADFKGKYVVLEWYNPDCPFVHKQYDSGTMQKLQKEYTAKGVVWLSINSSAEGKQGHYTGAEFNKIGEERKAAPTAVLLDQDGKVGRIYDAKTTPHMFVIDPQGKVIYQGAVDSKPTSDPADIATSQNYVANALDASMAGKTVTPATTKPYGCSVKY